MESLTNERLYKNGEGNLQELLSSKMAHKSEKNILILYMFQGR